MGWRLNARYFGWAATLVPTLASFIILNYGFNFCLGVEEYFSWLSLIGTVALITSFNTNYIFMTEAAGKKEISVLNYEFKQLVIWRVFSLVIVLSVVVPFKNFFLVVLWGVSRVLVESVLNYFRAHFKYQHVFFGVLLVSILDLLGFYLSWFYTLEVSYTITGLYSLTAVLFGFFFIIRLESLGNNNLSFVLTIKYYLSKSGPLAMSSIREAVLGTFLIYLISMYDAVNLDLAIRQIKLLLLGLIVSSSISNYYIQKVLREGRDWLEELFLAILFVFTYVALYWFLTLTELFDSIIDTLHYYDFLVGLLITFLATNYSIEQALMIQHGESRNILIIESSIILSFIILFCLFPKADYVFVVILASYLIANLLIINKLIPHVRRI